jgi:hypothetical protein
MHFVVSRWNGESYEDWERPIVGVFPTFEQARDSAIRNIEDILLHFYHHSRLGRSYYHQEESIIREDAWGHSQFGIDPDHPELKPYVSEHDLHKWDALPEEVARFVQIDVWDGDKKVCDTIRARVSLGREGINLYLAATIWDTTSVPG